MAEETEQMIGFSDVWSRRFVVWIAGMNPAGAEPSEWAVVILAPRVMASVDEKVAALRALKGDLAKFIGEMNAGPILIRLAWHDSGTFDQRISSWPECGGVIGSIRFEPELSYGANAGLAKAVNYLKPFAEKYPSVSWADLIQMASAVAVEVMGGPEIEMKYGRVAATGPEACVDGASREGFAGNAGLPDAMPPFGSGATEPAQHLRDVFTKKMGFTDQEIVAISGAHTVGRVFKDRSGACPFGYTNPTKFTNSEAIARHDGNSGIGMAGGGSWATKWLKFDNEYYNRTADGDLVWIPTDECLNTDPTFSLSENDRHEQQHGCEVTLPSPPNSLVSMTRSNTCQNQVLTRNVFFSCSSQSSPSIRYTSLLQRWRKPEQQSNEHFVDIADKNEKNDDVLEENNSKIYVKTINKKTISICYYDSMKAAVILEEVERRTAIPRDMTRLTHKGKDINEKKSMKDNNIDTNETIEMSMRLLGGMEVNEQMDTHETDEDREKKRKLDEGKEGKATKPSEDIAHLRKDIMEALKKTDEKMECYSRKNEEKMIDFSKKADDLMERFMFMTNSVGTQIQGMNSSIVKLHETNEKMKEEGESKFNKIDERFKDMEKRMMDLDMKHKNRSDDERNGNVTANQGETVIAGLHKETTESEVVDTLKEMIKEIGMDYEKVKLVCPAKPITHAFVYFENDSESNKFIRSANMLKKELKGRKIRITRSMEAEERFYNKRIGYVKNCINKKHGVPLHSISLNWNTKHVTIKGQIVAKTCQDGSLKFSKYQDVEDEVDELMQKWQTKNSS